MNVPALICRQALSSPDAVALRFGDTSLTYSELMEAAAAVAGSLVADGIGPGSVVGLCLERSPELVIAVLGVLLSGAAYLPADPAHPPHRLSSMLDSASADLLLVDGPSPLAADHAMPVRSSSGGAPIDWRGYQAPDVEVCSVIFTSGSTGEPKGVEITHAGLAERLTGMVREFGIGPADVLLQKTPCTFDVSMWELLLAFLAGGTLVVAPPQAHRDPEALVSLIVRYGVTMVHFVPSMLALFVTEPGVGRCVSLRNVLCGGEALPPALANTLTTALPGASVYNMYGPAEATIDVTAWPCRRPEPGDTVPVGRPLSGVTAYVVDDLGAPVPPGVPGELLLGGVCLARGYAGRPDLTAERFVVLDGLGRVYRTGDLACWSADGTLNYLGRIDTQVKIRGQRVELGEIEAVLRLHPGVLNAVVVLRRTLVAYVVSDVSETELRAHVAERLPEYMVPSRVVALTSIPTNAHGKADRSALPEPPRRQRVRG
jgi:amino acid adenylation domain-containing protein